MAFDVLNFAEEYEETKQPQGVAPVGVSTFDYGAYMADDLEEPEDDISLSAVVRRVQTASTVEQDDVRRTYIFQMLVRCGDQARKVIIDGESCMNIVSASTVERIKLPVEPHPHPYKAARIVNSTIPVTDRCLVSFSCKGYQDTVLCDVVPMKAAHIILERPWLYD